MHSILKISSRSLLAVLWLTAAGQADVHSSSTTRMEFKGTVGTMMKFFGGDKPIRSETFLKDRMLRTDTMDKKDHLVRSEIIDLERELFISMDHKEESYSQMTFAEWREMIEEQMKDLEQKQAEADKNSNEVEWTFDVNISRTGESREIAGQRAQNVILTVDVNARNNDAESEEPSEGGMIVTSTFWIGESDRFQEIEAFHRELAEKLGMNPGFSGAVSMMEMMAKTQPQLAAAMAKLEKEKAGLEGYPLLVDTIYKLKGAEAGGSQQEQGGMEVPTSLGGLFKGLGKKVKSDNQEEKGQPGVLMQTTTEVEILSFTALESDLFQVPSGYKLIEAKM